MAETFFFYDLETFGMCPRRSRIAQFAGVRTNTALEEIEAPVSFHVQPADDLLPSPAATLVTGITPQFARTHGLREADAFARIYEELARPGTCTLGYNTLRFDDEFIRHGLYRNFHEPYDREWRDGNSRADVLDIARLVHALRPDGIQWRRREDGEGISLKLEHLAEDNGLREGEAHEALSDVRATLGLARLIRRQQPRLWEYALALRSKTQAAGLVDVARKLPLLHVSSRFPASRHGSAPVVPITEHPSRRNEIIVFDLHQEPDALLDLDAESIARRLFTARGDLPEGMERVALKSVHLNKSPMLVRWSHLQAPDFERLCIDPVLVEHRLERLRAAGPALAEKVRQVHARSRDELAAVDADGALYQRFLSTADAPLRARVRATPPGAMCGQTFPFRDERFHALLLRYRARNWPETLRLDEANAWQAHRRARLREAGLGEYTLESYRAEIARLQTEQAHAPAPAALLAALSAWGDALEAGLD